MVEGPKWIPMVMDHQDHLISVVGMQLVVEGVVVTDCQGGGDGGDDDDGDWRLDFA